jgi:hypothetical protein
MSVTGGLLGLFIGIRIPAGGWLESGQKILLVIGGANLLTYATHAQTYPAARKFKLILNL